MRRRRRGFTGKTADRMAGRLAWFEGTCAAPACDQPIVRGASQIVMRKGAWIHAGCASGADDE